jgi:hypothetical protein
MTTSEQADHEPINGPRVAEIHASDILAESIENSVHSMPLRMPPVVRRGVSGD